jgi:tRNA 2-thiouridine synthesizing protein B
MALVLIKYGYDNPAEKVKMKTTKEEDSVVLIQNGVFWALKDEIKDVKGKIYAIKEDFLARGYSTEDSKVELIDYPSFIDILEREEKFIG